MSDYINERLQSDTYFYLIDIEFWKEWEKIRNEQEQKKRRNRKKR